MTEKPRFKRRYEDFQLDHKDGVEKDIELVRCYEIIAEAEIMAEWYEGPECTVFRMGTEKKNPARTFLERLSK